MNIVCYDCIWYVQCGHECRGKCDDFSPVDSESDDTAFYNDILEENVEEYNQIIQELADGSENL